MAVGVQLDALFYFLAKNNVIEEVKEILRSLYSCHLRDRLLGLVSYITTLGSILTAPWRQTGKQSCIFH